MAAITDGHNIDIDTLDDFVAAQGVFLAMSGKLPLP